MNENNDIIIRAMKKLGLFAEVNGRNDIVIDGRKFSGNAYLKTQTAALHHGTILISADTSKMSDFLNVKPDKLEGKGVASVKSRVVNLHDLDESIDVEAVKQAMKDVLTEKYGRLTENSAVDEKKTDEFYKKYSDDLWLYGKDVKLQSHKYKRFSWGYADVSFTLSGGVIKDIKVFSDSIFPDDIDAAIRALKGLNVLKENTGLNQVASDVLSLINE